MPPPPLSLVHEAYRILAITQIHQNDSDPERVVRALNEERLPKPLGLLDRLEARLTWRPIERSYGRVWTFTEHGRFHTGPTAFAAILCPDQQVAVLFEDTAARSVCPFVTRFAVERVCRANQWRFPGDLVVPPCAEAIWDMMWTTRPDVSTVAPLSSFTERVRDTPSGEAHVDVVWNGTGKSDRMQWIWTQNTLRLRSLLLEPVSPGPSAAYSA